MSDNSTLENIGSTFPILCPAFSFNSDISFQDISETFPSSPNCDQIFCEDFGKNECKHIAIERTALTDR